ncbi:MAG: dephospho-CoA kinase [Planctomycetota bacterium]|jgi:dephospho-CoA kinase
MSHTIIGLVGGIASGKSSVAALFAQERRVTIVDADALARRVLRQPAVRKALRQRFPKCIGPDGELDRSRMARRVFSKPAELEALEAILHPPIRRAMRAAIRRAKTPYMLIDAPLLQENGIDELCDAVVYVACDARTRRRRARLNRGWSEDQHRLRESRQWPVRRKRAHADYVVDNNTTTARARQDVRHILRAIERN